MALELATLEGLGVTEIAKRLALPRSTVRDWLAGRTPRRGLQGLGRCRSCGWPAHVFADLPREYAYLLGLYLGDGCISRHPRSVFKLRITLDLKYPDIVRDCVAAIAAVVPRNRVGRVDRLDAAGERHTHVEVWAYSRAWPCLLPQHGPGKKHGREIVLTAWQNELITRDPKLLLRGLIHSDGCRFINTGTNWIHPRYMFSNYSEDILQIFVETCRMIGVRPTTCPRTVYVSRKDDVALLDNFIGPKT